MEEENTITKIGGSDSPQVARPARIDNLIAESSSVSDVGNERKHNEDSYYSSDEKKIWVVADGMGGHKAGDIASQCLTDNLSQYEPSSSISDSVISLEQIVHQTNDKLVELASEMDEGTIVGSTLALLISNKSEGVILWAGDSRVYRIRMGEIEQLTSDHNLVNKMISQGTLDPKDSSSYPETNKITRAVGFKKNLNLDHRNLTVLPGDRYILCSDGLTKYVSADEILKISEGHSVTETNETLLKKALDGGGSDNITTLTIEFKEG